MSRSDRGSEGRDDGESKTVADQLQELKEQLDTRQGQLDAQEGQLSERKHQLDTRQRELDARQGDLDAREEKVVRDARANDRRKHELDLAKERLDGQADQVLRERVEVDNERQRIEALEAGITRRERRVFDRELTVVRQERAVAEQQQAIVDRERAVAEREARARDAEEARRTDGPDDPGSPDPRDPSGDPTSGGEPSGAKGGPRPRAWRFGFDAAMKRFEHGFPYALDGLDFGSVIEVRSRFGRGPFPSMELRTNDGVLTVRGLRIMGFEYMQISRTVKDARGREIEYTQGVTRLGDRGRSNLRRDGRTIRKNDRIPAGTAGREAAFRHYQNLPAYGVFFSFPRPGALP